MLNIFKNSPKKFSLRRGGGGEYTDGQLPLKKPENLLPKAPNDEKWKDPDFWQKNYFVLKLWSKLAQKP